MANKLIQTLKSENNFTTGIPDIIAKYECDTVADLPAQNQTEFNLQIGTTAHVIDDNAGYQMQSNGTWRLQRSAGYYTQSQIDSMFAGIPASVFGNNPDYQLEDGDDLNNILLPGNYTAGSNSIAQGVANSPWTTTRYKFVNFVITGSTAANLRAVQFLFPNLYANQTPIIYIRYRHNATFTPWHIITASTI